MPCIRSRSTRSGGRSRDRCRALRPTDARSRPSRKAIRRPASPVLPGLWRFRGPSPAWRGRGRLPADHKVKCGASGLGAEATPGPNLSRRFAHNLRDAFSIRVRKSKSAIEAAGEPAISRRPPPDAPANARRQRNTGTWFSLGRHRQSVACRSRRATIGGCRVRTGCRRAFPHGTTRRSRRARTGWGPKGAGRDSVDAEHRRPVARAAGDSRPTAGR